MRHETKSYSYSGIHLESELRCELPDGFIHLLFSLWRLLEGEA